MLISSLQAGINSNNDTGVWTEEHIRATLPSNWIFFFSARQDFANHAKTFCNYQQEIIFHKDFTEKFTALKQALLGVGCNETKRLQNADGKFRWISYTRPLIQSITIVPFFKWDIFNRVRLEYEVSHSRHFHSHAVFRYQVRISPPWFWTKLRINPYIFNEWFFRKNTYNQTTDKGLVGPWFQNRFRLGVNMTLIEKKLDSGLYLQWRAQKQRPQIKPRWFNNYQLGLTATYFY